ncbi:MAG TPA: glycosyltransferase [Vicinamibacterales bacterium]
MPDALILEGCDFAGFPPGGQMNLASQLARAYGPRVALVGISTDSTPVGTWVARRLGKAVHDYFAYRRRNRSDLGRPLVPGRITQALAVSRYMRAIRARGVLNAFVQAPDILMVAARYKWDSLCYKFPGANYSLAHSRYPWAKYLNGPYERLFYKALEKTDRMLVCLGGEEYREFVARMAPRFGSERFAQFPPRVDTSMFHPAPKAPARRELGLPEMATILVCSGRLNRGKGWDLPLEAVSRLRSTHPDLHLVYVGDGEDREALAAAVRERRGESWVTITGAVPPATVARYLQACDLVVTGSYREGWSNAVLEGIATGRPVVTTRVSGAAEMVQPGGNGVIVESRDPDEFAAAILQSLSLPDAERISVGLAQPNALSALPQLLGSLWLPLKV